MNYYIFDKEIKNNNTSQPFNQLNSNDDFLMPKISNQSIPLKKKHDNYMIDRNAELFFNQNQGNYMSPMNTRGVDSNSQIPVQQSFQQSFQQPFQQSFQSDYFMNNFETLNHQQEKNMFLDRNPVNSRRDMMEKSRNQDRKSFLDTQGGNLTNFTPIDYKNTREKKKYINTSSYIPNSINMPIPKENI